MHRKNISSITSVFFLIIIITGTTYGVEYALQGRVYEGVPWEQDNPIGGVTVELWGANNSGSPAQYITGDQTDGDGFYRLILDTGDWSFNYYIIWEKNPTGYYSTDARSVTGTVLNDDQIQFGAGQLTGDLTGNKFWDMEGEEPPANNPPVADADGPYTGQVGQSITLDASGSYDPDPGDFIISHEWDLDDDGQYDDAVGENIYWTWSVAGLHTVGLKVTDSYGETDTDTTTVDVQEAEPPDGSGTLDGYKRDADTDEGLESWRIFIDFNGNGQWDEGEPSDLTDGNGYYRIDEVEPGTYRVCEQMQDGWEPAGGGSACVEGIDIIAGTTTAQDFHNRRIEGPEPETGSIRGMKFEDINGNGIRDPGEPGLPGWQIDLWIWENGEIWNWTHIATATTDASGSYSFEPSLSGDYQVREENKSGWTQTYPAGHHTVEFNTNQTIEDLDFGNYQTGTEPPEGGNSIRGMKYNDLNGNGQKDPDEPGLPDWEIRLTDSEGNVMAIAMTDQNGEYQFDNLEPGTYGVSEENKEGWLQTFPPENHYSGVMLSQGQVLMDMDFGNRRTEEGGNSIRGMKYNDLNGNGQKDPDEPGLSGWSIFLDSNDNSKYDEGEPQTTTDSNGNYEFTDLEAGVYRIYEVNQPGWRQTAPAVGGEPGYWLIDLEEGQEVTDVDFGNIHDGTMQQTNIFGMCLNVDINLIGIGRIQTSLSGPAKEYVFFDGQAFGSANDDDSNGLDEIATELFELNLQGIDPAVGQVRMRLNPTKSSTGQFEERINNTVGILDMPSYTTTGTADSFFDVYFEIELPDLGLCYRSEQSIRLQGVINSIPPQNQNVYSANIQIPVPLFRGPCGGGAWSNNPETETPEAFINSILSCQQIPTTGEYDFGDAPDSYKTYHNSGGPYHDIGQVMIGNSVDAEQDGQPGPLADADNDDGVSFPLPLEVNQFASVVVNVNSPLGVPAAIVGWIDYDQSGTFEDPAERIAGGTYTGAGVPVSWTETFKVPSNALAGWTYARFRIYRTETGVDVLPSPTGYGEEGEVEDYRVEIKHGPDTPPSEHLIMGIKFNDLDGDGLWEPGNGESGLPNWTIWLDTNNDGIPEQTTQTNNQGNFEFSGVSTGTYTIGEELQPGWIQTSPNAPGSYTFTVPAGPLPTAHFMMFGNRQTDLPTGQMDFGDAPDPTYPTLLASNGARHVIDSALYLGSTVDGEADGLASTLADGDDQDSSNDEDGVILSPSIAPGQTVPITVIASGEGAVNAWLDFNIDGDWADAGEHIITAQPVVAGANTFNITVPANATLGLSFARFRLSSVRNLSYTGQAPDGEVEDYAVEIKSPEDGSVIIVKKAFPSDDTKFTFCIQQSSGFFNLLCTHLQDPSSNQWIILNPGNVQNVYEASIPGWTLTDIQITGDTDNGSVINVSGYSVNLDFDPGENIVITFINEKSDDLQYDYGDAPEPYPDASHELGGPYLGLFGDLPDPESGMQRDLQALGDDNDSDGDDENGLLSINLTKTPGVWSTWELKGYFGLSSDAIFGFWIDLNGDGDWDDPNELRATFGFCGFGAGPQDWYHAMGAFQMPTYATEGMTYARLRVYGDCNATVSPSGAGGPGEVEDYAVEIKTDGPGVPPGGIVHGYKWNDLDGNGQWHPNEPALTGWTFWLDINNNGQEDAGDMYEQTDATGHFKFTGVPAGTYTLGEQLRSGWMQTTPGGAGIYTVTVQPGQGTFPMMFGNRKTGGPTYNGRICGSKWNDLNGNTIPDANEPMLANWKIFLDYNQNYQWDPGEPSQLTDASGSFEFTGLAVGSYRVAEEMQPGWQQTWPGGVGTHIISVQPGPAQPACVMFGNQQIGGPGPGLILDFGDAPDPSYPTLLINNGARHTIIPGIFLGGGVDVEPDGQPAPDARGDDHDGSDDEDGVTFITPIIPGQQAEVEVFVPSAGYLDAWIDFDADGNWAQVSDQIFASEPLISGSNILTFQVPAGAAIDIDTYARFRFSSIGALTPEGPAQDGEVEDYHILIGEEGPYMPGEGEGELPHVKWSQPPIEIDPNVNIPPVFCGWNEPARSTENSGDKRLWRMDADDFRCLGPIPITRIRWWGAYKSWRHPEPPELQPESWHIGFWANQVEGLGPDQPYLERLVWSLEIPADRIHFEPVGLNEFPQKTSEMCFLYEVPLEPEEWFHQAEFESNSDIFWITITAVYPADVPQVNMWTWTTRPHIWGNGAVMPAIMGDWPTFDERLFPGRISPIENSLLCGQNQTYDLCFELLTEQPWVKWDQPFTGIREWPGYADGTSMALEPEGGELSILQQAADDWFCERRDPVTAIAWNGSYIGYGYEACKCEQAPEPLKPDYFLLSILSNTSGADVEFENYPGEKIWEYKAYDYDEVLVGYDRNPEGEPNEPVFRYSVRLPEEAWFRQPEPESIYWFSVVAVYSAPFDEIPYKWGWTNHQHMFGIPALVRDDSMSMILQWQPPLDWVSWPVDMSFTFFTAPESRPIAYWKFDETEGTTAIDSTGRHHGAVYNGSWSTGIINGALNLNGLNCYIDCGDSNLLGPEHLTLTMWLYPEHMGGIRYIASRGQIQSENTDYTVKRWLDGEIEFVISQDGGEPASVVSEMQVPLNRWSHVAVVCDSERASVYINGILDSSIAIFPRRPYTESRFILGSLLGNTRFYHGKLDDVRLYDRVLSDEQIIELAVPPE